MSLHRYVVLAQRVRGFDELAKAREYAEANVPSVICERKLRDDGTTGLVQVLRNDFLYDEARGEWRIMLG
jgi:hypothetical protein